jgi:hypothetical protein
MSGVRKTRSLFGVCSRVDGRSLRTASLLFEANEEKEPVRRILF